MSTVQALCYKRTGLPVTIDDKYVTPFLPTTKPERFIPAEEIEVIKELLISTVDTLNADLKKKIFGNYTKSERIAEVYNIDITNIEDAIEFLLYHEGFHTGYILALKRLV